MCGPRLSIALYSILYGYLIYSVSFLRPDKPTMKSCRGIWQCTLALEDLSV